VLLPRQRVRLAKGAENKEHAMSQKLNIAIAVIGIDIGKNSFHVVGLDDCMGRLSQKSGFEGRYGLLGSDP
jgi:hypothetical protein